MPTDVDVELDLRNRFHPNDCRRYLDDELTVVERGFGGPTGRRPAGGGPPPCSASALYHNCEQFFGRALEAHFRAYRQGDLAERIQIAEQYFAASGLGQLDVLGLGPDAAVAELRRPRPNPGRAHLRTADPRFVPAVAAGFLAALCAVALDLPLGTFRVAEATSDTVRPNRSVFVASPAAKPLRLAPSATAPRRGGRRSRSASALTA